MVDIKVFEGVAKILETEVVKELYGDLQPTVRAVSNLVATLVVIVGTPGELGLIYRERMLTFIREAKKDVPKERLIAPAPSLAGPILEGVKYLEDGNPLRELYRKLLSKVLDKDGVQDVHPAFPRLIGEFSPYEAYLLWRMVDETFTVVQTIDVATRIAKINSVPTYSRTIEYVDQKRIPMYLERLNSLGLIRTRQGEGEGDLVFDSPREDPKTFTIWVTTEFGRLFAKTCIPEDFKLEEPEPKA